MVCYSQRAASAALNLSGLTRMENGVPVAFLDLLGLDLIQISSSTVVYIDNWGTSPHVYGLGKSTQHAVVAYENQKSVMNEGLGPRRRKQCPGYR